jgi:hypothetical protein
VPQEIMDLDLNSKNLTGLGQRPANTPELSMGFDFAGDISIRLDTIEEKKPAQEGAKKAADKDEEPLNTFDRVVVVNHKTGKEKTLLSKIPSLPLFIPAPDGNYVLLCSGSLMGPNWPNITVIDKQGELIAQISFDYVAKAQEELQAEMAKSIGLSRQAEPAPKKSTPEERNAAFQWFSGLGVPDLKDCKIVRAATGQTYTESAANSKRQQDVKRNIYLRGFLIEESDQTFKVLTLSLLEHNFRKTSADKPAAAEVSYETLDLKETAQRYLKDMTDPWNSERNWSLWGDIAFHMRTEAFVLAWACWRNGLPELAADLFDQAANTPDGFGPKGQERPTLSLQKLVDDDIALRCFWRSVQDFGDLSIPRSQLVKQFERIVKYHADSVYQKEARAVATLLSQMIEEDAAHVSAKPFEQLSKKEQIAELIHQLRDQTEFLHRRPENAAELSESLRSLDARKEPRQAEGETAADKLMALGYDAVPQLLEHLEDLRFTRAWQRRDDQKPSHHIQRVSDCVLEILRTIAGQGFWEKDEGKFVKRQGHVTVGSEPDFTGVTATTAQPLAAARKDRIQAWYADLLKKGEQQMLIEGAARGDFDSCQQALRLLQKYPEVAPKAILAGFNAANDDVVKDLLLVVAGRIKGETPVPVLLAELKDGVKGSRRVLAADLLHERGRPEPVEFLMAYWDTHRPKIWVPARNKRDAEEMTEDASMDLESVASFLGKSNHLEAIAALAKDLRQRPVDLRNAVVASFSPAENVFDLVNGKRKEEPGYTPEVCAAIERLLITALDDREDSISNWESLERNMWDRERICDAAARSLAQYWPKQYKFQATALHERDREIDRMRNAWRGANGMDSIPAPPTREIALVPDDKIQGLVQSLLQAPAADRPKYQLAIEQLGLGALPAVVKLLEKSTDKEDDRALLEKLSQRMASIVSETVFAEYSVQPSDDLIRKWLAMNGKPFEPKGFMELVKVMAKDMPAGVHGLRFFVYRPGDDTGMKVKIDLLDEARANQARANCALPAAPKPAKNAADAWQYSFCVNNFGGNWIYWDADLKELFRAKESYRNRLQEACAAAPDERVNARLIMFPDCPEPKGKD